MISKNIFKNLKLNKFILLEKIPFNPFPGSNYKRPSNMRVTAFKKVLQKEGYITTVRTTRGEDIMAACGQLVGQVNDRTKKKERQQKKEKQIATRLIS